MSEVEQLRQRIAELEAVEAEWTQAKKTLRRVQDLHKKTQALTKVGGWAYDVEADRITWTDEVYRIYGVDPATYNPNDIEQDIAFYAPEDQARIAEAFHRAVEKGEPYDLDLAFHNVQGERLWVRTIGRVERREGETVRVFGHIMDITEQVRMEEELRERERLYRTLFEEGLNPIMMADETGRYIDANKAALEFLECDREEVLGKHVWDFAPEGLLERQKREHTPFASHRTLETEYLVHGDVKTLLLNVVPVKTKDETIVYGIGQDITERVRAEKELRQHRKHLEERVKERTAELRNLVDTMAGREVRMAGLKETIKILRAQLEREGLEPMADDPLLT